MGLCCLFADMQEKFGAVDVLIYNAALRAFAQMLNAELKDKGIFAGIVQIMGIVGSNEHFAPKNIAEAYWKLYTEKNFFEFIFD